MGWRIWAKPPSPGSPISWAGVRDTLVLHGIEVVDDEASEGSLPGLVFFDQVSEPLCRLIREASREGLRRLLAIATSASGTQSGWWSLLEAGASDVFAWSHSQVPAQEIAARLERWQQVDEIMASDLVAGMVGQSRAWLPVLRQMVEVGRFTEASVLITGESGTGKELGARLIHALDSRTPKGRFVIVDCTTVVPSLSGSEFFGHEKGAFTGAASAREGAFALADGGTLFLDEVGELPGPLQAELLRVVQERMFKRVGSDTWRKTSFRLLSATNRDLLDEVSRGRFRRDLYYRITAFSIHLPSLDERQEDILPLARSFFAQEGGNGAALDLDPTVETFLRTRRYPGNVRELKQLVSRICSRHAGTGPVTAGDVPPEDRPPVPGRGQDWKGQTFEECIRRALAHGARLSEISRTAAEIAIGIAVADEGGNLQRASRRLGVTDRALQLRRARRDRRPLAASGPAP